VLFGGLNYPNVVGDTWVMLPSFSWTQQSPAMIAPPARELYAMVYDAARRETLLSAGAPTVDGSTTPGSTRTPLPSR